ncbi:MAG TPA: universal stress protein [Acidimicrobiales bacterium]|nr:universal stress protein [Acidimicrobiales bacterium]
MEQGYEKIVVGVDGSEPSREALEWAARQAELTGARLSVVTAWAFAEEPTPFGIVPPILHESESVQEARRDLEEVVAAVRLRHRLVDVQTGVVMGRAAEVLIKAAQDADLLVVGSRGRGALAGMVLGSVSEHCVRHAPCPVVVVRPVRRDPT